MQKLSINPELQRLIPPLTREEYQQLESNVLAEGIREAILIWNGTVVDGHNRYNIAQHHGLEYDTSEIYFKSLDECKEWMILNQFGRRNLSNYQRSVLALELEQVFRDKAKANQAVQYKGSSLPQKSAEVKPIETRKELAKVANVSHDTIAKVKVIESKANDGVKAKLQTGEVSINQVYQEIKKQEKSEILQNRKSREIIEANKQEEITEKFNVQFGQVWILGKHTLTCASAYDFLKNEATAIITDPPYGIDYNPDWKKWDGTESDFKKIEGDAEEFDPRPFLNRDTVVLFGANYFTRHLPTGGWLCWDKRLKDELDDMIGSPFELAWFKSAATKKSSIMVRVLHGGVVNADSIHGNNQKRFHPTQKPIVLMEEIIKKTTKEKETICDPFCGSGTTLLAAENTGRTCIAYEVDPAYCNIILSRFQELTKITPWLV
jgi:DNA modification methylase